jgi:hypothetical protein
MNYTITRLDRRHSWHSEFAYMIEFAKRDFSLLQTAESPVLQFDRSRRWFNDTFGWSQDVEVRAQIKKRDYSLVTEADLNNRWTWSIRYDEYRIYTASEQELEWFVLSHPQS